MFLLWIRAKMPKARNSVRSGTHPQSQLASRVHIIVKYVEMINEEKKIRLRDQEVLWDAKIQYTKLACQGVYQATRERAFLFAETNKEEWRPPLSIRGSNPMQLRLS